MLFLFLCCELWLTRRAIDIVDCFFVPNCFPWSNKCTPQPTVGVYRNLSMELNHLSDQLDLLLL